MLATSRKAWAIYTSRPFETSSIMTTWYETSAMLLTMSSTAQAY